MLETGTQVGALQVVGGRAQGRGDGDWQSEQLSGFSFDPLVFQSLRVLRFAEVVEKGDLGGFGGQHPGEEVEDEGLLVVEEIEAEQAECAVESQGVL